MGDNLECLQSGENLMSLYPSEKFRKAFESSFPNDADEELKSFRSGKYKLHSSNRKIKLPLLTVIRHPLSLLSLFSLSLHQMGCCVGIIYMYESMSSGG